MMRKNSFTLVTAVSLLLCCTPGLRATTFADAVVSYDRGAVPSPGFTNSSAALGSPERFTGEGGAFPSVVSPFSPPFLQTELVSIGEGGQLTLRLERFALPQPGEPEIGVFANVGLISVAFPDGRAGDPVVAFGIDSAVVEVSETGAAGSFVSLGRITFDLPTNGFTDLDDPFSTSPGAALSDFGRPFTGDLADFAGLPYSDAAGLDILGDMLLDGSGGGRWLDLSATGLSRVGFVRFRLPDDGDPGTDLNFDLDAVSVALGASGALVPEPSSFVLMLLGAGCLGLVLLRRRSARLRAALLPAALLMATATCPCHAETILSESFSDDPIAGGRAVVDGGVGAAARFTPQAGSLAARYDTVLPTAKLLWPLGRTLIQSTDFSFQTEFTIRTADLFADPNAFAQISFGLVNSNTTGTNRAGGGTGGDAYDVVMVDYFPNVSPAFGGPTLGPTIVETDDGTGFFSAIRFEFGGETALDDEGPLPLDVPLTAAVTYQATTRQLALRIAGPGGPLDINSGGGSSGLIFGGDDGDEFSIRSTLPSDATFAVDAFALALWEDTFRPFPAESTVRATVDFSSIEVFDAVVPEPPSVVLALLAALCLAGVAARRRAKQSCRGVRWSPDRHELDSS